MRAADGDRRTRPAGRDIAVATTGAGGPGSAEGQPAGTVFVAVETPSRRTVHGYQLDGDPEQVVKRATLQALRDLHAAAAQMGGQIRGVSPR
jgi:nicotinamide-nucleotide amidase